MDYQLHFKDYEATFKAIAEYALRKTVGILVAIKLNTNKVT